MSGNVHLHPASGTSATWSWGAVFAQVSVSEVPQGEAYADWGVPGDRWDLRDHQLLSEEIAGSYERGGAVQGLRGAVCGLLRPGICWGHLG